MSILTRLYSGNPGFDFRPAWRRQLVISIVLLAICIASFAVRDLDLGIEFEGGGVWEVPSQTLSIDDARDALRVSGNDSATIQVVTTADGDRTIRVQGGLEAVEESDAIVAALAEAASVERSAVSVNTVGPSWGDAITDSAVRAFAWFFVAIAAYLWIRLEWKMAVGSLVAVVHTIVITVGVYSIFQFEVTPATVVAFLTILGFSLYDTIIVFDKVQRTTVYAGVQNRMTYTDVANLATNQVVMRSVNTSLVATLPVLSLLVVGSWIMGATTLEEFAIALTVGQVVGAYTSIFVAVPIVVWWKEREPEFAQIRERLGGHREEPITSLGERAVRAPTQASGPSRPSTASPTVRAPTATHPPRPRKKGKRR